MWQFVDEQYDHLSRRSYSAPALPVAQVTTVTFCDALYQYLTEWICVDVDLSGAEVISNFWIFSSFQIVRYKAEHKALLTKFMINILNQFLLKTSVVRRMIVC